MAVRGRFGTIIWLLHNALENDEKYFYEGASRSYAHDAASELKQIFERKEISSGDIAYMREELSVQRRIDQGRSARVLIWLGAQSHQLLIALAHHDSEEQKRRTNPAVCKYLGENPPPRPLTKLFADVLLVFDDPDDQVRLAAVSSSHWMWSNYLSLRQYLQTDSDHASVQIYQKFLARLDDPSAKVRSAAALALGKWAKLLVRDTLAEHLAQETEPEVREALAAAIKEAEHQ